MHLCVQNDIYHITRRSADRRGGGLRAPPRGGGDSVRMPVVGAWSRSPPVALSLSMALAVSHPLSVLFLALSVLSLARSAPFPRSRPVVHFRLPLVHSHSFIVVQRSPPTHSRLSRLHLPLTPTHSLPLTPSHSRPTASPPARPTVADPIQFPRRWLWLALHWVPPHRQRAPPLKTPSRSLDAGCGLHSIGSHHPTASPPHRCRPHPGPSTLVVACTPLGPAPPPTQPTVANPFQVQGR